ncbi:MULTISPECIES: hypothetical protein [Elizabethkingia]|uniref:Uncharacterized protein n=1 Tax=Elizabethkingia meningoseptica TaxID=238 RepID=A0A1T3FL63_ELIME|nr:MULTISPECIES: hypothetical protein [Elizabethkingia]AQX13343.1 hypothetical protein BBD35_13620 [Elizabethkingia meningoseptica]MBG0514976.1 hypothetical protein [Elizabethkingia meningoseptica]MDE5434525.1 hypothetical protein [Elizabethkingia meningoseptica]MDE5481404.1 hypothetical protein [Elizabethkingia meningoseptica]MDE5537127.1 hypothetical protein [Elizabethkingia meningoseptica]
MLRDTLIKVVKDEYGVDLSSTAASQSNKPIIEIFKTGVPDFSKYKLAKAFIRWTKNNEADKLTAGEIENWKKLIQSINKSLK